MTDNDLLTNLNSLPIWDEPLRTPSKKYVICTTPRSGSNLLMFSLLKMGLGLPMEYLNWQAVGFSLFVERLGIPTDTQTRDENNSLAASADKLYSFLQQVQRHRTTENNIFGMKLFSRHINYDPVAFEVLKEALGEDTIFIYLYRKDMIAQAVSLDIAFQTEVWHSEKNKVPVISHEDLKFDYTRILTHFKQIKTENQFWVKVFGKRKDINVYRLEYGDFIRNFDETLKDIYSQLGVADTPVPEMPIKKQENARKKEFKERFIEISKAIRIR